MAVAFRKFFLSATAPFFLFCCLIPPGTQNPRTPLLRLPVQWSMQTARTGSR